MKKLLISYSLLFFSIIYNNTLSQPIDHEQLIHKYLTVQGWNLVRSEHPEVIYSEMNRRMCFNVGQYGDWWNSAYNGTLPWQTGKILTGAYREDEEDVVYDNQGIFNANVTNTHFWDADEGDGWTFSPPQGGTYENSYNKFLAMWNGKRIVNGQEVGVITLGKFF